MYSQEEINSAVDAGVLSEDAAKGLRAHVVSLRERPVTDEEHFRLVSSFNDIFVAIGVVIMLFAVGAIGQAIGNAMFPVNFEEYATRWRNDFAQVMFGGALIAGTAWFLAEMFTRKRRMALPSIILLLAFVGATLATTFGLGGTIVGDAVRNNQSDAVVPMIAALSALVAAGGAGLHWKRFAVPITIAAGAGTIAIALIASAIAIIVSMMEIENDDQVFPILFSLMFIAGLAIFAWAMRWDISDRTRETRRADVAFWLHLLAAPMIAHPVFYALGVTEGNMVGIAGAIGVIAVYFAFGIVALAIDRRALLVSALVYVLIALTWLFDRFGAVELNFALTALIIGSALLTLSAFWTPIRQIIVGGLPENLQEKLPVSAIAAPA